MKTTLELIADRLNDFKQRTESRWKEKYAVSEIKIEISSGDVLASFSVSCTDKVEGFIYEYGESMESVLANVEKKLTPLSALKKQKIAQAKRMLKEAEAL